jgi:hypothetical protein
MSELRIVFDGPPGAVSGRFVEVETPDGASVNAGEWHERDDGLWELRISIPGANAVVTPQGLLAAGHAYEAAHKAALDTNDYEAGLIAATRAALEAAGIEVVDVVVEFVGPDLGWQNDDGSSTRLYDGDTLFIHRKESSDDQG